MMENTQYLYTTIVLLAICTAICRAGYLLFGHYITLPEGVRSALRYAPLAALTGIVIPELLPWHPIEGPQVDLRLLAAGIAVGVFLWTRNGFLLIVSGMLALWASRWALGL
jgi:branched-subunit amino acid transport protein